MNVAELKNKVEFIITLLDSIPDPRRKATMVAYKEMNVLIDVIMSGTDAALLEADTTDEATIERVRHGVLLGIHNALNMAKGAIELQFLGMHDAKVRPTVMAELVESDNKFVRFGRLMNGKWMLGQVPPTSAINGPLDILSAIALLDEKEAKLEDA